MMTNPKVTINNFFKILISLAEMNIFKTPKLTVNYESINPVKYFLK